MTTKPHQQQPVSLDNQGNRLLSIWFVGLTALFVTVLITANIVAVKVVDVGGLQVPAGTVTLFPLAYLFGDALTEVYGYARARQVIWIGFACNALAVAAIWVAGELPGAAFWDQQEAYDSILGFTYRLLLASFAGYLVGEFVNSFILARLKLLTRGRWLWSRTISSTLFGQFFDTGIFILVAFAGVIPDNELLRTFVTAWLVKVGYEVLATPLTYAIVNFLKKVDASDHYDQRTNFNPFSIRG